MHPPDRTCGTGDERQCMGARALEVLSCELSYPLSQLSQGSKARNQNSPIFTELGPLAKVILRSGPEARAPASSQGNMIPHTEQL